MEEIKEVRKNYIQIIFLICLIVAICALIYTTITIIKYKDVITNPMGVTMAKFNLNTCTCIGQQGIVQIKSINFNESIKVFTST